MSFRTALATLLLLSLYGALDPGAAQSPRLTIEAGPLRDGGRALLRAQGLLQDPALQGALESGLPLRFHLRVELWERAFFDRLRAAEDLRYVLVQDPLDRELRLDGGVVERRYTSLADAQRALERELRSSLSAAGSGRYYYLAVLEIETLSLSDLEELRRWLRGEVRPAVEGRAPAGRAVERGIRRLFVRVIGLPTRRYEARSATFVVP